VGAFRPAATWGLIGRIPLVRKGLGGGPSNNSLVSRKACPRASCIRSISKGPDQDATYASVTKLQGGGPISRLGSLPTPLRNHRGRPQTSSSCDHTLQTLVSLGRPTVITDHLARPGGRRSSAVASGLRIHNVKIKFIKQQPPISILPPYVPCRSCSIGTSVRGIRRALFRQYPSWTETESVWLSVFRPIYDGASRAEFPLARRWHLSGRCRTMAPHAVTMRSLCLHTFSRNWGQHGAKSVPTARYLF
jgi:hypothetical protein